MSKPRVFSDRSDTSTISRKKGMEPALSTESFSIAPAASGFVDGSSNPTWRGYSSFDAKQLEGDSKWIGSDERFSVQRELQPFDHCFQLAHRCSDMAEIGVGQSQAGGLASSDSDRHRGFLEQ